ncbi:hypothetical protein KDM41_03665 [bacterium]|nr:hypothetical protein [bacterium]
MAPRTLSPEHRLQTAAALVGGLFFLARFGPGFLDPGRVDWLLGMADTAFNQLAWTFFRADAWHWPPGAVTTFMAPVGTTVGLTDSLPLLAFPGKLLGFLLPEPFQYAGLWLLVNHALMVLFAVRITGRLFPTAAPRLLAAGLLVLCPAWLIRDGHFALSAHWVYLAALDLYLRPDAPGVLRAGRPWWLLLAAAALIHPYPATFGLLLLAADQGRRLLVARTTTWPRALAVVGGGAAVVVVLWILAGFLRPGYLPVGNLPPDALWSASPQALWDGQGRALLTPELPRGRHEPFEGFVYLGLGGLGAVLLALLLTGRRLGALLKRHGPLVVVLVLCAAYAFGPRTALGDRLYRAQARFLWPHFYVLVGAGVVALSRWRRPRWPLAALAVLFVLQLVDLWPLLDRRPEYADRTFTSRLRDPRWHDLAAGADLLLTTPAPSATTVYRDDFVDLTVLAHAHGVPTSAGFATRSYDRNFAEAERLTRDFFFGASPDPATVGIMRRSHFAALFPRMSDELLCTDLDGYPVCVPRTASWLPDRAFRADAVTLAAFLAVHLERTVILAGRGDAANALTPDAVALLTAAGSQIGRLPQGASYAAIFVAGRQVFEQIQPGRAVGATISAGAQLGGVRVGRELSLTGSGEASGPWASLLIDGREVLFNAPGLNAVALDADQNVVATATFAHPDLLPELAARTGGVVFSLVAVER